MDISYSVNRSSKRTKITITIERDRTVVVQAPNHASDEAIARIVEAKRYWIYEKTGHGQKYTDRPHPPGKELLMVSLRYISGGATVSKSSIMRRNVFDLISGFWFLHRARVTKRAPCESGTSREQGSEFYLAL